jgi:Raf kinase inhibitor-like YbhB/YbcL family protein
MKFALSEMQLTSTAFDHGGSIPAKHSGEGADTSPPLEWSSVPDGANSFAVICHDPDAPVVSSGGYGFVHWVLYNIPAAVTSLAEGEGSHASGPNDFGTSAYGGPMPPNGHGRHHYFFWVIALARQPDLEPGLGLRQLLDAIEPDVVGMNRLMGTYERS